MTLPSFRAASAGINTATTSPTLSISAPTVVTGDVLLAVIAGKNNVNVGTGPAGWTELIAGVDSGADLRASVWWKFGLTADAGMPFSWVKDTDDDLLAFGLIYSFKDVQTANYPFDPATPVSQANGSSDAISFPDFVPTSKSLLVIYLGVYGEDQTTPGVIVGTNPSVSQNSDQETSTGSDGSLFCYSGTSTGGSTGTRMLSTSSTVDAPSIGFVLGIKTKFNQGTVVQDRAVHRAANW